MKLNNVKIGERYFGYKYVYIHRFMHSIRLLEIEIVKVNKKTVGISFDSHTKKYPQLLPKEKDMEAISEDPIYVLENFLAVLDSFDYLKITKRRMRRYCQKKLKELQLEAHK